MGGDHNLSPTSLLAHQMLTTAKVRPGRRTWHIIHCVSRKLEGEKQGLTWDASVASSNLTLCTSRVAPAFKLLLLYLLLYTCKMPKTIVFPIIVGLFLFDSLAFLPVYPAVLGDDLLCP